MRSSLGLLVMLGFALVASVEARDAPSRPGIDAPELAHPGRFQVGVRTFTLVDSAQVDVLAFDPATGAAPKRDRPLTIDLWYPAEVAAGASPETYSGRLPAEPPAPPTSFTIPGIAVRDAQPATGRFPLVVVSHGYSNETIALSWLTENLASKGYVVAAIRHEDPPITDRSKFTEPLLRRPLDIAFVTRTLQLMLGGEGRIDPSRTALVGYSMGGYGVLTVGGGVLDPGSPLAQLIPGGLLAPYARGGAAIDNVRATGIKAIVAFAPGGGSLQAWVRRDWKPSPRRCCSSQETATRPWTTGSARAPSSTWRRTADATC